MKIRSIEFVYLSDGDRRLIVHFDDEVTITYGPLYESWINLNTEGWSTVDHTWIGVAMADKFNDWLHGEDTFRIDE